MIKIFKKIRNNLISFCQKIRRGYSYYDIVSLDCTIADFILPRLKYYKENNIGHPCDLSMEEWLTILDKMIYAFDSCSSNNAFEDNFEFNSPEYQNHREKIREGLKLFAEHFESLWL